MEEGEKNGGDAACTKKIEDWGHSFAAGSNI